MAVNVRLIKTIVTVNVFLYTPEPMKIIKYQINNKTGSHHLFSHSGCLFSEKCVIPNLRAYFWLLEGNSLTNH